MLAKYIYRNQHFVIRYSLSCIAVLMVITLFSSCKKGYENYGNPATVQIFNGMDDNIHVIANLTGSHPIQYNKALFINNKQYSSRNTIFINKYPQPIAFYGSVDTLTKDQPLVNLTMDVESGSIYSLFVFGPKNQVEYLLHKDVIPFAKDNDSLAYFRFVNLSTGQDISVNLKGEPAGSLAGRIDFKGLTAFISLQADKSVSQYEFEFRDSITKNLLASYTATGINNYSSGSSNPWINKATSLVFSGQKNGSGSNQQKVTPIMSQVY